MNVARGDRDARADFMAKNIASFGAPVVLLVHFPRLMGPPQWSDVGMFMQTFMLLAVEQGLATCAQEYWARYPKTVAKFVGLPDDHMLFSGMALGYADEAEPINQWRTRRDPLEVWCEMRGFE
jgi:nitroreductase